MGRGRGYGPSLRRCHYGLHRVPPLGPHVPGGGRGPHPSCEGVPGCESWVRVRWTVGPGRSRWSGSSLRFGQKGRREYGDRCHSVGGVDGTGGSVVGRWFGTRDGGFRGPSWKGVRRVRRVTLGTCVPEPRPPLEERDPPPYLETQWTEPFTLMCAGVVRGRSRSVVYVYTPTGSPEGGRGTKDFRGGPLGRTST